MSVKEKSADSRHHRARSLSNSPSPVSSDGGQQAEQPARTRQAGGRVPQGVKFQLRLMPQAVRTHGSKGRAVGQFKHPKYLAFGQRRSYLYVADTDNHRIVVLRTEDLAPVTCIGGFGSTPGHLKSPTGVALDHKLDRLLVADFGNHRVQAFSLSKCLGLAPARDSPPPPPSSSSAPSLSLVSVDPIALDSTPAHAPELIFGSYGSELGQLNFPEGVVVEAATSNVYVADSNNHRVAVYSSDGEPLRVVGGGGQLKYPLGLAFDDIRAQLFVCDSGNGRVVAFAVDDVDTPHVLVGSRSSQALAHPCGVAFDPLRKIVFATEREPHHRIVAVDQESCDDWLFSFGSPGSAAEHLLQPCGLAVDERQSLLFVADRNNHRIAVWSYAKRSHHDSLAHLSLPAAPALYDAQQAEEKCRRVQAKLSQCGRLLSEVEAELARNHDQQQLVARADELRGACSALEAQEGQLRAESALFAIRQRLLDAQSENLRLRQESADAARNYECEIARLRAKLEKSLEVQRRIQSVLDQRSTSFVDG